MKIRIKDISVHKYAELNPMMTDQRFDAFVQDIEENGQLEPIKVSKNKYYDGRNRIKALILLGEEFVEADVNDSLSEEEILTRVGSLENRRHQTPTQLAILALKEYTKLSEDSDTKVSQEVIAKKYGISRKNLAEAKSLRKRAEWLVDDTLFNGGKYNIGTAHSPNFTNNIRVLNSYFKDDIMARSKGVPKEILFTDDEMEDMNLLANDIISARGEEASKQIAKLLYSKLSKEED